MVVLKSRTQVSRDRAIWTAPATSSPQNLGAIIFNPLFAKQEPILCAEEDFLI